MKVILTTDVYGLGEEGDIVDVSNGYARNFLLPKGKVIEHNTQNLSILASRARILQRKKEEKQKKNASIQERLEQGTFVLKARTNEKGHLYGAVSNAAIVDLLSADGIEIHKQQIQLKDHQLKSIGEHLIVIKLDRSTECKFVLQIESENHDGLTVAEDVEPAASQGAETENPATSDSEAVEESVVKAAAEPAASDAAAEPAVPEAATEHRVEPAAEVASDAAAEPAVPDAAAEHRVEPAVEPAVPDAAAERKVEPAAEVASEAVVPAPTTDESSSSPANDNVQDSEQGADSTTSE